MTITPFDRRISRHPRTWVAQCGSWCGLNCDYCYPRTGSSTTA